jgi:hypothetical protein
MGFLSWLALGAGAALAPFTGGASLAIGGAVSGALGANAKKDSVINNNQPTGLQSGNASGGGPGSVSGNWFTGKQFNPNVAPYHVPGLLEEWAPLLQQYLMGPEGLKGVPAYGGQLSPDINETILPEVFKQWTPNGGAGQDYLTKLMQGGGFQTPAGLQSGLDVMLANGGLGGRPTQGINDMMTYGGVPGAGLDAMKNLMMYGVASEAGRPMANLAQFGVTGPAGMPLHARATGQPGPATNFLAAYMPQGGK